MIEGLIDLIEMIRKGYGDFQDRSLVGQSEMDRKSRRLVNTICGVLIAVVLIAAAVFGFCFF